mmetsp:Transcript_100083/g.238530  ORF Transcript_100083/g.238530 Transcript_100083/m.238530 type:complete len:248 (-) Transcript_100083:107-850(-)
MMRFSCTTKYRTTKSRKVKKSVPSASSLSMRQFRSLASCARLFMGVVAIEARPMRNVATCDSGRVSSSVKTAQGQMPSLSSGSDLKSASASGKSNISSSATSGWSSSCTMRMAGSGNPRSGPLRRAKPSKSRPSLLWGAFCSSKADFLPFLLSNRFCTLAPSILQSSSTSALVMSPTALTRTFAASMEPSAAFRRLMSCGCKSSVAKSGTSKGSSSKAIAASDGMISEKLVHVRNLTLRSEAPALPL